MPSDDLTTTLPVPASSELPAQLPTDPGEARPWQDATSAPGVRVEDLMARMTLEEKVAQLYGVWVGADEQGESVAPHQHDLAGIPEDWDDLVSRGLGQLTRPFGTAPVDPALGARSLARAQERIRAANRFDIPALAHEECLAGFTTWKATIFPVPLAWGATFDPELVQQMAHEIGRQMRSVGVHQGLSPVLDVTVDPRWGRTEETVGEDPYLVATVTTAYVRGLEEAGVIATLKHFVGYSSSQGARNLAPVSMGPRELADVLLPPFELAVREGRPGSVMQSYSAIDGLPVAADPQLLTGLLRDQWGFEGTVVADYFGITFLQTLHGLAAGPSEAALLALTAGVDVELPTLRCYGPPLVEAVRSGAVPEALVDRALRRVLLQKCALGLLDADWQAVPPGLADLDDAADAEALRGTIDLDPPAARALARRVAEESVVLLEGGGLPLSAAARISVVGPLADDAMGLMGCYSFPSHVGSQHPELPLGVDVPTLARALHEELPGRVVGHLPGCAVDGDDTSGFGAVTRLVRQSDVCVVAVGDRAGLFGRGTSGEGCDAADLTLPGVQGELIDTLLDTGVPVVLVVISGRPYALGRWADRLAGVVQAFFPGEEGGRALAGVLSGSVNPSGRLPVSVPRGPGGQPWTYLGPALSQLSDVSSIDPTPLYPFGSGSSYTSFEWTDAGLDRARTTTDGCVTASLTVRNTGSRAGAEVVQLYLHDPVASVSRPVVRLIGYARLELEPGQARRVSFDVHAELSAFTGADGSKVVEPGDLELRLSHHAGDAAFTLPLVLLGDRRVVDHTRVLRAGVRMEPLA